MNQQSKTDNPFRVATRRQLRKANIAVAFSAIVGLAAFAFITYLLRGTSVGIPMVWMVVGVPLLCAVFFVPSILLAKRTRRIAALVPEHDGMVCPKCIVAAQRCDDVQKVQCAKCSRVYHVDALRRFWDMSVNDPMEAARFLGTELMKSECNDSSFSALLRRLIVRRRTSVVWVIAINAVIWLGAGTLFGVFRGGSLLSGALTYSHMFIFMTGFFLISIGLKQRRGNARRCAACKYQRVPNGDDAQLRCPECGADWNAIGGTEYGEVRRQPQLIVAGAVCVLLALIIMGPMQFGGWGKKIMPTNWLISEIASAPRGFTMHEWQELNTRTLTQAQLLTLAKGLVDKQLRKGYLSSDAENWMTAQIAAGALPDELVQRYYQQTLDVWIVAPERANVGENIELAIGTRYRVVMTNNPKPVALVSGFFIGDETEPRGRQNAGIAGISLGKVRYHIGDEDRGSGSGPVVTFTPTKPGQLRIRLELWLAHMPMPWAVPEIQWQANGTPATPNGAVRMEHRVVEHMIEVLP